VLYKDLSTVTVNKKKYEKKETQRNTCMKKPKTKGKQKTDIHAFIIFEINKIVERGRFFHLFFRN